MLVYQSLVLKTNDLLCCKDVISFGKKKHPGQFTWPILNPILPGAAKPVLVLAFK
jgi:hypothetical protein